MSFSEATLGPFYDGIPVLVGLSCLTSFLYLTLIRRYLTLATALAAWFGIVAYTSFHYTFVSGFTWNLAKDAPGLAIGNALFSVPLVTCYLAFQRSTTFRQWLLADIPAAHLIAFQANRIAGAAYFYLYHTKVIDNYVALQVGIFDMVVAVTAPFLAMYVQSVGLKAARGLVMAWNVFGFMDLVIPFSIFPFNLFDLLPYRPPQSLSFFFLHPIPCIFLFNVPLAAITHVLFLTNMDAMTTSAEKHMKKKSK